MTDGATDMNNRARVVVNFAGNWHFCELSFISPGPIVSDPSLLLHVCECQKLTSVDGRSIPCSEMSACSLLVSMNLADQVRRISPAANRTKLHEYALSRAMSALGGKRTLGKSLKVAPFAALPAVSSYSAACVPSLLKMSAATFHSPPKFRQTTTYFPASVAGPFGPLDEKR